MSETKKCAGCLLSVGLLLAIILISVSVHTLDATTVGLDLNTLNQNINPSVFTNGRHFLGVGHKFIKFPTHIRTIEFSNKTGATRAPVNSASSQGQVIGVECSVMYRIKPETIFDLYQNYTQNYHTRFADLVKDALQAAALRFPTNDYFQNRNAIRVFMQARASEALSRYATVNFFQLREIRMPSSVEQKQLDTIIQSQRATREVSVTRFRRAIIADTSVVVTDADNTIRVEVATETAAANLQRTEWYSRATREVEEVRASATRRLKDALGFTDVELAKFLWVDEITNLRDAKLLDGVR